MAERAGGRTWWGRLLADRVGGLVDEGRLARGRSYARSGKVLGLDLSGPRVVGTVAGSEPRPYSATVSFTPLRPPDADALREAVAADPALGATLLSGVMPDELVDDRFGLFPTHRSELDVTCTCPDFASPCKHAAAVLLTLVDRVDAAPATLLRLRGQDVDSLVGVAAGEETESDLADLVDDFFSPRAALRPTEVRFRPVLDELDPGVLRQALMNGLPSGPVGAPVSAAVAYLQDCYRRLG
ncbi:hypothetical protein GCM10027047_02780 [Rhodococcus aerolatus]